MSCVLVRHVLLFENKMHVGAARVIGVGGWEMGLIW